MSRARVPDHACCLLRAARTSATIVAMLLGISTAQAHAQIVAITGGRVHTVSGPTIENGTVVITNGRITAVGANVPIPANAQRIDASGKIVTPGLINGATALGVMEIGAVPATVDVAARGEEAIAASVRVWDALNPASVLLAPAREEGVTSVAVLPAGGLVAGQAALVDLTTGSVPDMVVRGPAAMVAQIANKGQAGGLGSRAEVLARLREVLDDARVYARRRADFERGQSRDMATTRLDMEALQPVLAGDLLLLLHVDKASDIQSAIRLAREYRLRIGIVGGAEAWMVAQELAAARIPVLTGATNNIPTSFETLGSRQENAGLLRRAGVNVVLVGGSGEAFNVRNVRQEAGNAVAYGMSWEDALRGVTLSPAELYGVADRYGSLEPGKVANVVVWSGDPLELMTTAERVFVRGREIEATSRQRELMERYKRPGPGVIDP